jgi:cell division septation protein DedD
MPSREPELYKDKIEVSLDGRQIFYLFFGGAVIVGLVFVLGVMVGRRVEARGHLDRPDTQTAGDPLAALDRLERSDKLSFHGALTGAEAPTDVERAIGEIDKRRAAARPEGKPDPKAVKPDVKPDRPDRPDRPDAKPAKPEVKTEAVARPDADKPRPEKHDGEKHDGEKHDADKHDGDKRDADKHDGDKRDADKHDADKHDADKHDGDRKSKKHDDSSSGEARTEPRPERSDARRSDARGDKPVTRPDARPEAKPEAKPDAKTDDARPSEGKPRFTLQLSSFQDRSEAEAFLTATKSAGHQAYLTEAEVAGKGTFYRVRLGSYRSLEAANDAKADYEKAAKKPAQVMRL